MNQRIHDIALEIGGSHYPTVGGKLLESAVLMAVKECIQIALNNDDLHTAEAIAKRFGIEQWA